MTKTQLDRLTAKHFSLPETLVLAFLAASHGHVKNAIYTAIAEGFAAATFNRVFDHLMLEGIIERRSHETVGVRLMTVYYATLDAAV